MEEAILQLIRNESFSRTLAAKEITSMMTRFFTWMYCRCNQFVLHSIEDSNFYNIEDHTVWTLEQVFIYWKDNILNIPNRNGLSRTKFNNN